MDRQHITNSPKETKAIARDLIKNLSNGLVICLRGPLGSGKTTFVQGVGEYFSIDQITSPTYVLLQQYPVNNPSSPIKTLNHLDLYRIESVSDIKAFDPRELWQVPNSLTLIEWPERIAQLLPKASLEITFEPLGENSRKIIIKNL
ncbi:tRNA (adenosine(37)-N6)-threonylcarbamoyltransferase complex ATPase subunit type 1 TsaE [Candidatus Collierbacteria bacterium]|nr:tRNA (adenosine(37)-N6)-threonylcarbamoyltransferase complex ATPase subunit type 1 TsaE [Candidatus Collierbacteria bacterium]